MFETKFQHASSTPLPPTINLENALKTLHDFPVVVRLNPDCRGCKPIPAPQAKQAKKEQVKAEIKANGGTPNGVTTPTVVTGDVSGGLGEIQYYEVEDDLPFMPKRQWSGGVKYIADFQPTTDGCDITVHAPGGFTSTNHWRLVRQVIPDDVIPENGQPEVVPITVVLDSTTKDLSHAETTGGGWYVQIDSDAVCNRTFAGIVKGFLKNSHQQLQTAFIERLQATPVQQRSRRPTLGRRRSSVF